MKQNKQQKSNYSPVVRITCLCLSILVSSGILVYLVMLLLQLFGN